MNMFLNILETSFDDYFHKEFSHLSIDNPVYLQIYREEAKKFADFLVTEYLDNAKNVDYWFNRAINKD